MVFFYALVFFIFPHVIKGKPSDFFFDGFPKHDYKIIKYYWIVVPALPYLQYLGYLVAGKRDFSCVLGGESSWLS